MKNKDISCDVLILNASLRQSLVTMRSLGKRGVRVGACESAHVLAPAFSSRWCQHSGVIEAVEAAPAYLAQIEQILEATQPRVLIASSDGTIELLRCHRQRTEQRVRIALAKESALGMAVNKERTLEVAQRLGIEIPRSVAVSSVQGIREALREIGLPAVVKPVESWVWGEGLGTRVASRLVTTPDEAKLAVEALTCSGGHVLFQQYLTGRREAISFLYANHCMYARFAQWARRTNPPLGGTSVLRQSIALPADTGEQAERLIREIELEGYSEVEFRRDDDGRPYLMEINPRLSASVELAVHAGVDFPYLLFQWASGEGIDMIEGYQVGCWMRYLGGDIAATLAVLRQRGRPGVPHPSKALLDFFLSFLRPMKYDYIDWRDPRPLWSAIVGFPHYLLQQRRGL